MIIILHQISSQVALVVKNPPANAGDTRDVGSIRGSVRSPGEGNGTQLQYSCLENSMDCIVHGVAKSWTGLSDFHFYLVLVGDRIIIPHRCLYPNPWSMNMLS